MGITRNDVAIGRILPRRFDAEGWSASATLPAAVEILRGRQAVAEKRDLLVELCHRTGQAGTMDDLDVWLAEPSAKSKIPCLVLVGLRDGIHQDELDGAVLVYEYTVAGRATGILATDHVNGERTVIAPAEIRTEIAEIACRALVEDGATVVLVSLRGDTEAARQPATEPGVACRMATRKRIVPRYLPLAATFDATLATLGNDTRRNFRRYRRRLERDFNVEFVPQVSLSQEEFLAINRASINPLPEEVAIWRFETLARLADPIFYGLRCTDGRWFSLAGGRRRPGTLVLDWQMNLAGMPRYSLCTVMRAFLLEYEITRGTEKLLLEGGTPHSMRHSFTCVDVVDVIVQRRSAKAWLLRRLARWIFPATNFLAQTWRDKNLRWTNW